MRYIVAFVLYMFSYSLLHANDINISTVTNNGSTLFFLQAGVFNLEKDAQRRQQELAKHINLPIETKKLAGQNLYLVQIGPIDTYVKARSLKASLSKDAPKTTNNPNKSSTLQINQPPANLDNPPQLPPESKLWNLRNADIRAVIAEVSRVTGKNFVVDPRVQGKISIISSTAMSSRELYQVFLSVLQVSGYAAIPSGDIVKIIPNIDAKTQSIDAIDGLANLPKGDEVMVAVTPIHYVSAEQLVPVLRPLMPQWSSVSAYGPSNMLILSGRADNIKSLAQIIKQVDSSAANGVDLVHLKHALAMDVTNTIKDLVKTQANSGSRTPLTIAADDRSNAILVSGTKTDRIRLRILILKLDKQSLQGINANTQVVYLNYLRAEDLVPILAGIAQANFTGNVGTTIGTITRPALDSTNPASNLANSSGGDGQNGASISPNPTAPPSSTNTTSTSTQNEGSTKPSVQIIAEPNTNSIIINAPAFVIRILKNVISQLDIKPAQLLIEALVAEVDEAIVHTLGIEWGTNQQTRNNQSFSPGFAIINSKTSTSDFQAQISALAKERRANILSTPSVVVLDNRQAKILVGEQVSIQSTSYPNNAGGTAAASPYTTFSRVNVALHLYVRPQITRGQGIQMQIDQGNDTLDPASSANSPNNPTFKISSIVTSVHVESGDIVVLGGLTQNSLGNNDDRIPILGDIPGIGRLFQKNSHNRAKRVLMVFIKPIILRNERDSLHVTGEKYNDMRQTQLDWLRSEEIYNAMKGDSLLPPLTEANLPIPFTGPSPKALAAGGDAK